MTISDEQIRSRMIEISDAVDKSLQKYLRDDQLSNIVNILLYEQQTSGKRLRPSLAAFVSQTLGGDFQKTIDVATACELLHSASLMLDDAIDGDATRRGSPAVHVAFGAGMAMMGTYIQALIGIEMGIATDVRIGRILVNTIRRLVIGTTDELSWCDWNPDTYYKIIQNKTASLFEAPCLIGAIVGKPNFQDIAQEYGYNLGVLYQLCDDYVDIAKSIKTGTPTGDLKAQNTTLAIIDTYKNTIKPEIKLLLDLYRDKKVQLPDSHLRMILLEIVNLKSLNKLEHEINRFRRNAEVIALKFPENEYRGYLESFPAYIQKAQFDEIDMPDFTA